MANSLYSKKVIEHFHSPHNYGRLKNPSAVGKIGNIVCGDVMYLYIKVDDEEKIKDIKFETFGCAAAIATSSMVTDLAKGKTIKEALKITSKKVFDSLNGLPPIKVHCSLLAVDALHEAIYKYLKKKRKKIPLTLEKKHQRLEKEKQGNNGRNGS